MNAVQIPDELRRVIDRQVAEGRAASAAEFLEAAVRRYARELEADEAEMIATANAGIEAIRRGDYVTISIPEDEEALRQRLWYLPDGPGLNSATGTIRSARSRVDRGESAHRG